MKIILKEGQTLYDVDGVPYILEQGDYVNVLILTERIKTFEDALNMFNITQVPDASTLKDLYRTLSKNNHPDKGGDLEVMKDINAAYDLLKDNIGKGSSGSSRNNWKDIERQWEERNHREMDKMEAMFENEFNIEELVSYLQPFTESELQYTVEDNLSRLRNWTSAFLPYQATVEVFNVDMTTVFHVDYSISYNYNNGGGLSSNDIDEKDILYTVSINANIYHDRRKEKLSQNDFRYGVGHNILSDYEKVFPSKKLTKIFSSAVPKKAFKKADMLLGLKRECEAEFNDEYIYFYLFGKRGETKTYLSMYRTTMMRMAGYMFGGLWGIDPTTGKTVKNSKRLPSRYVVTLPETQESLEGLVAIIDTVKEVIRKEKLDESKDFDRIYEVLDSLIEEYFPKQY